VLTKEGLVHNTGSLCSPMMRSTQRHALVAPISLNLRSSIEDWTISCQEEKTRMRCPFSPAPKKERVFHPHEWNSGAFRRGVG